MWLAAKGGSKAACVEAGLGKNVETRISNILHGESFGSRGARALETKLSMPDGYLDGVGEVTALDTPVSAPEASQAQAMSAQAADLAGLLDMVSDRIARSEVYSKCSQIIIEALRAEKAL